MSTEPAARRRTGSSLDPDALAELERERDFLLRSLDDLDAEHAAGDLDGHDYLGLVDDYTRRVAEVVRSIEDSQSAFSGVDNRLSGRQRLATIGGVVLIALVAGLLLARASGFRSPDGSATGGIRQSSAGLLAEADTLTREGAWPEALEVYGQVLNISPANVEALTYRGWLASRLGESERGLADLTEAIELDPQFPDARVFAAVLLDDAQQFDAAADQLAALDAMGVPDEMEALISGFNLRGSIAAGQIKQRFQPGDQIDLTQINASLDDVARAGAIFSQLGDATLAQASFDAVLSEDPDQVIALVGRGQLARDPGVVDQAPELAARALLALDKAVEVASPDDVSLIRLYRADARAMQGDLDGARSDIAAVEPANLPEHLRTLYDQLDAALS